MQPLLWGLALLFLLGRKTKKASSSRQRGDSPGFERELDRIYADQDVDIYTPRKPLRARAASRHAEASTHQVRGVVRPLGPPFIAEVRGMVVGTEVSATEQEAVKEGAMFYDAVVADGGSRRQSVVGFMNQYNGVGGSSEAVIKACQRELGVSQTGQVDAETKEALALNVRRPT
jgi:hypothetical protein